MIKKPNYLSLWVILLLKANHRENKMIWNNSFIVIKEGQFITGRDELSRQSGISPTTVERILKYLENGHQIEQQKTTKYRLITIVNWKEHQTSDRKTDNKRTTNGQQTDTNKNEKNEKKESSTAYLKEIPESDIEEFYKRFDCSKQGIKDKAETLALYCEAKGKRYKNYRSFLLNALKKDFKERRIKPSEIKQENEREVISKETLANLKPEFLRK